MSDSSIAIVSTTDDDHVSDVGIPRVAVRQQRDTPDAAEAAPSPVEAVDGGGDRRHTEARLNAGALQSAIFNSANFSSIATDA